MIEGHEVFVITCRHCGHRTERINIGNELVGKQGRMKCSACGKRGADFLRVWTVGPAPKKKPGTKPG